LVDAESVFAKLGRLDSLLGVLEQARAGGKDRVVTASMRELDDPRAFATAADRRARESA
jgi:hypothetical protein